MNRDNVFTLSEYERLALASRVNLSDGHAKQELTLRQRQILERTLDFFDISLKQQQETIERDFLHSFFTCAGQTLPNHAISTFLTFSSSSAIKMAAQYCRIRGLTVFLIDPCFDNILNLLQTERVPVSPILENQLTDPRVLAHSLGPNVALWLVLPNNPTGFCLDQHSLMELARLVADRRSTLVIDFCFRFHAQQLKEWDQYAALSASGVNFICFEDTGKTWALADTKVGITVCSQEPTPVLYTLHDQLLLNVSPLHLLLLTEFVKDTYLHGYAETVGHNIAANRALVHDMVNRGSISHATPSCHNVPMELLRLPTRRPSDSLWKALRGKGVDILPAMNYFWSRPWDGYDLFRVPLSRPTKHLELALPLIEKTVAEQVDL
jgi:aspartate/methionine/tyrosine aminotransferase